MVKRVLMVAFHYPPCAGSSGLQRALKFSRYLPEEGWEPLLLSANSMAYPKISSNQMHEIPPDIVVTRSFCLDAARHLAIAGRYPKFAALPDRWSSWQYSAVRSGMRMIREYRPQLIWSTYPIATAHVIAQKLHQKSGIPWVADFRDSMTEEGYPADQDKRRAFLNIERTACEQACAIVFTAPGALRMYAERYPQHSRDLWVEIPNGYDDANFPDTGSEESPSNPVILVHSGIIYPSERDPTSFFDALAELREKGVVCPEILQVVLRATGHDVVLAPMIASRNIGDIVLLKPRIGYSDAIKEIMASSALLIFQASSCNHQIPAKLYEYMHAKKPVLGVTDPAGDTAEKMREVGLRNIVQLDDREDIENGLVKLLQQIRAGTAVGADQAKVIKYSRRNQTTQLADLFDSLSEPPG